MENRVEWLICEIQKLASNLHFYKQSQPKFQASPLHDVRILTSPTRQCINFTESKTDNHSGPNQPHRRCSESSNSSDSPLVQGRRWSVSSHTRENNETKPLSQATSAGSRSRRSVSVDESRNPRLVILEHPESPRLSSIRDYDACSNASFHSTCQDLTNNQKESHSSPAHASWLAERLTSIGTSIHSRSQYIAEDGEDYYYTLPVRILSSSIAEEQVDCNTRLSQLAGGYRDEGSPKQGGSTFIIRKSSLTGQLEHFRKPHCHVKKVAATETKCISQSKTESGNHNDDGASSFRVLNKGVRTSSKRKSTKPTSTQVNPVLLDGIETTVWSLL